MFEIPTFDPHSYSSATRPSPIKTQPQGLLFPKFEQLLMTIKYSTFRGHLEADHHRSLRLNAAKKSSKCRPGQII